MDARRIVEVLQATLGAIEAGQREEAEKVLLEVYFGVKFNRHRCIKLSASPLLFYKSC